MEVGFPTGLVFWKETLTIMFKLTKRILRRLRLRKVAAKFAVVRLKSVVREDRK